MIAMAIYFVFAIAIDLIARKCAFLKRIFKGKPSTLIYDGKINYNEIKRCKIDVNDLLGMLRAKSYFDIKDVAYAILETSGDLSILPKGNQKPVVIEDLDKSKIEKTTLTNILILDGTILKSGLDEINKTEAWLLEKLKLKSKKELKNIIFGVYDEKSDNITTYLKNDI